MKTARVITTVVGSLVLGLMLAACGGADETVEESDESVGTVSQAYSCGMGGLFDEVGTCPGGMTCESGKCIPREREPGDHGGGHGGRGGREGRGGRGGHHRGH